MGSIARNESHGAANIDGEEGVLSGELNTRNEAGEEREGESTVECNEGGDDEESKSDEGEDFENECELELGGIDDTLPPNADEELLEGIELVKDHFGCSKKYTQNQQEIVIEVVQTEHGEAESSGTEDDGDENGMDNSDVGSMDEEVEEDGTVELRRKPKSFERYNEKVKEVTFNIGLVFTDHLQFKKALYKYAVNAKRDFKYLKNGRRRVRVRCMDTKCNWLVYAAIEKHGGKEYFMVKTLRAKHSRSPIFKIQHITSRWIAVNYESYIFAHPGVKPTYLVDHIKADREIEVSRQQCKRAKGMVMEKLAQDLDHEYTRIHDSVRAIEVSNPGSTVDIQVEHIAFGIPPYFKRLSVCFAGVRQGFLEGCRKFLGVDGCFLKGVVKGQLLIAVGKDANNQYYPLAWAMVEIESTDSWTWFCHLLARDIDTVNGDGRCFMSDQSKGLDNAIRTVFPNAEHRLCARHIYSNWYSDFRGEQLKIAFYAVAKSSNEAHLQKRLEEIERLGLGAKAALERTSMSKWCRKWFRPSVMCDSVDNNSTEAFNFVLIGARSMSIITMFERIREYVMERRVQRLDFVRKWRFNCRKKIREIIAENTAEFQMENQVEWK